MVKSTWTRTNSKYELQLVKDKHWYLRLVSKQNNETLMVSETYYTKFNAKRAAAKLLKSNSFGYLEVN